MAGNFTRKVRTFTIAAGATYATHEGLQGLDLLNIGSQTAFFTGQNNINPGIPPSTPVPLPPFVPYTLEYAPTGYEPVFIDNTGNDNVIAVVEKY